MRVHAFLPSKGEGFINHTLNNKHEIKGSLLTRVTKNSIVGLLEKIIEISTGMVSIAILARYLDIETFGLYTLIVAVAGMLLVLSSVGLDRVIVRDIATDRENFLVYLQSIKGAGIILTGISLLLIAIISFPLGLNSKSAIYALFIFAISEVISMYGTIYMSVFKAFERMEYNTVITLLTKVITLSGLVMVAYFNWGFLGIFISMAIGNIGKILVTIYIFARHYSPKFIPVSFNHSKAIVKDSLIIAASTFFTLASIRMGVFMLKTFGTLKDVAYFQAANVLLVQLQPVALVIVAALYPAIASRKYDSNIIFENAAKIIFMLSLPLMALAFFYGNDVIMLVYGHKYMDAVPTMKILILSVCFTFLAHLLEIGLLVEYRQDLLTTAWGIAFLVNVFLGIAVVPLYGLMGCAIVMSLSYMTLFFVLYFFVLKKTIFKIKSHIFIKPIAAFIVMSLYLYFFSRSNKPFNIAFDIMNMTVSTMLYLTVLFLIKAFSISDIKFVKRA